MRNQEEINKKISETMKRKVANGTYVQPHRFKRGFDPTRRKFTNADRKKAVEGVIRSMNIYRRNTPLELLSKSTIRKVLIEERSNKCEQCKNTTWLTNPITIEVEHKDGNTKHNNRDNLLLLCPNCHSYTPHWRRKKNGAGDRI